MDIGRARVSTGEQDLVPHVGSLKEAKRTEAFTGTWSGAAADRPVLADALGRLSAGHTPVVWRLDCLGRCPWFLIPRARLTPRAAESA